MILPLEQMVPLKEFCEKLKELGFPQDTYFAWNRCNSVWRVIPMDLAKFELEELGAVFQYIAAPTNREMMVYARQIANILSHDPNCIAEGLIDWAKQGLVKFEKEAK